MGSQTTKSSYGGMIAASSNVHHSNRYMALSHTPRMAHHQQLLAQLNSVKGSRGLMDQDGQAKATSQICKQNSVENGSNLNSKI